MKYAAFTPSEINRAVHEAINRQAKRSIEEIVQRASEELRKELLSILCEVQIQIRETHVGDRVELALVIPVRENEY